MLRSLSIRDFVIVEHVELEFSGGFTALTGETGAGKSMLVDALSLVLGERADPDAIRAGAERAEITAEFDAKDGSALAHWLRDNGLEGDAGACLVRRLIEAGGRSRAFINGHAATVQQLREAGEFLVDVHGQHAHQSLLRAAAQRELLDDYGGHGAQAATVGVAWREWRRLSEARAGFEADAERFARERGELAWQTRELAQLDAKPGEWQAIGAEHSRLAHAAALIEAAQFALDALDESDASCVSQLDVVCSRLGAQLEHDARLKDVLDVLEPARIQLQEAVYALRHYQQRLELDPQRLREVEQRLDALHAAARRHRVTPEELPELAARLAGRLRELDGIADGADLQRRERDAQQAYTDAAQRLSAARAKAARELSSKVTAAIRQLAMGGGKFSVELSSMEPGGSHGIDQIEFQVAAHEGAPLRPLAKVASGGELSRISLAIQTVASEVARVPTLIFDEVDAGIGGRVAEIVGTMLKGLGRRHQVRCVTHLPQVAAAADQQWQVTKSARAGKVESSVTVLDGMQRVEELARMLGGVKITETTRKHAAEMLGIKT